jgi:hypothetical protein
MTVSIAVGFDDAGAFARSFADGGQGTAIRFKTTMLAEVQMLSDRIGVPAGLRNTQQPAN